GDNALSLALYRPLDRDIHIERDGDEAVEQSFSDVVVAYWRPGDPVWRGKVGGRDITAQIRHVLNGLRIDWQGLSVNTKVFSQRHAELDRLMPVK
ncbi:acetyl/propionyl-CoA carboxylase subunit alpha, partial [Rhizobium johnstonii]